MPPVAAAIAAIAGAISAGTGVSVGIVTSVLVSGILTGAQIAIGAVVKLFIHPKGTNKGSSSLLTTRDPISYRRVIYGTTRVGGTVTDIFLSGTNNEYLHLIITLTGHQVQSIGTTMYLDSDVVPLELEADGWHPVVGNKYRAHLLLETNLGDPASSAQPFPTLHADEPTHWTNNHLQRGCAKVHLRMVWDATIFANGLPSVIAFDIQGKKVFDPRTSTTVFSNNPALCVRDFLTDSEFGFNADAADIDDTSVIAAANICDELVAKKDSTTQTRYSCDGTFTADQLRGDVLNSMLSSMAGFVVPPGDMWRIFAGAYTDPVLSLTDSDITGPIKYDTRVAQRDLSNGVKGTYISGGNNYQPSDFTPYQSATYLAEDGDPIWQDIQLDFTNGDERCQRLAKIIVEKSRRQNSLLLPCKMTAFQVTPGDTIEFTHSRFGFSNKTFMVTNSSLEMSGASGSPVLGVTLTCIPVDSSIYDWNPATDEQTPVTPGSTVTPDMSVVQPPTSLVLSNVEVTRADGIKALQLKAAWTAPADIFVLAGGHVQVWIADHGVANWRMVGLADGADTAFYISGVVDGNAYDVKLISVNSHNVTSAALEVDNFTASATAATFGGIVSSLDNVNDGVSYARPIISRISAGKPLIDFSEGIHLNKNIDNIPNGASYRRVVTGSTGQNSLDNATFQAAAVVGSSSLVAEWTELVQQGNLHSAVIPTAGLTAKLGVQSVAINQRSGTFSLGAGASVLTLLANDKTVPASPGDTWLVRAWLFNSISALPAGVNAQLQVYARVLYSDGSSDFLCVITRTVSDSDWTQYASTDTVPTPVGKQVLGLRVELAVQLTNTTGASVTLDSSTQNSRLSCNQCELIRLSSLENEVLNGASRFAQTAGGLTYRPTSNPLTATDAGSNDTVSIAAFTMRCTGHADVSVSGGSITALSYSTLYYIYYDDATLAGGAVTFNATTTKETAINGSGRFFVGSILTPAASGAATVGNNDGGVGAQGGGTSIFLFGTNTTTNGAPTAYTITNSPNCFDGNTSTFGKIVKAALSANSSATLTLSGMSPTSAPWQSLTLKIKSAVPTMGIGDTATLSYSLDNGVTFTNVYSVGGAGGTRAITVDSVSLPVGQNLALVRVKMSLSDGGNVAAAEIDLYEAWVVGVQ